MPGLIGPVQGEIREDGRSPRVFHGWLELLSELETWRREVRIQTSPAVTGRDHQVKENR